MYNVHKCLDVFMIFFPAGSKSPRILQAEVTLWLEAFIAIQMRDYAAITRFVIDMDKDKCKFTWGNHGGLSS